MNLELQRKMDRTVGVFICRFLSLFSKIDKSGSIGLKPQKILIILLSEMGSLVLAWPMLKNLKKEYGNASVFVLLFEQNREFLEIMNAVHPDHILTVRTVSLKHFLMDSLRVAIKMRQIKIDTVLDCELFSRISSIYSFLSGAKIRAGFHPHTQEGLFRGSFINRPVLYNPYHHISQQFINLVKAVDSDQAPSVKRPIKEENFRIPSIKIGQQEMKEFWKRFTHDFPQVAGKKIILLYPSGGLLPIRAWPLENFCLIAEDLIQKGYAVGIIGMKKDKALAGPILSHCGSRNCLDLTGYTKSVRELMIVFHFASLLITNDGGPGHFAAMTPIPNIIFYGPETPLLYGALNPNSFNFYNPLSCSPCLTAYNHRNSPCNGDNLCLKSISPKSVLQKSYEILEKQNFAGFNHSIVDSKSKGDFFDF